ncbi:ATP-dependent helicase C-terminal domain-containing protein [Treponema sp.]|uniref:ATP-dependent helicase C-terminal domain-containing protein n=1 Tax=Treponema sp. TaxID=166 RepID=UPI00388D8C41
MTIDETKLNSFPVFNHIDKVCRTLKESKSRCLIMTAETGAGKSTVFPLGLLRHFEGNIIMTEPRRLSVLGTAARISSLMGEECGQTCGYRIKLESKVSKETRLQLVTEAILVRMLQDDMALENFNVVVLDEFHERSVSLDLISSFVKEAQLLRDDLYIVVMSATIDAKRISSYFNDAPIVEIPGRTFPVEIQYKPNVGIESAVIDAFNSSNEGNVLVFLPGIKEIRNCTENLRTHFGDDGSVEILTLHSSISIDEQKRILKENDRGIRRIIVSSAIAETSLTVPDVTCVVDSGLCRMNVFNPNVGMQKLVTLNESEFSAAQRSGRAGRTKEGKCIRLWSKNDVRQKEVLPEILRSELSSLVLECAERGQIDLDRIDFLDRPSKAFWNESIFFLEKSGMLKNSRITDKGRAVLKLGMDIRLAGLVLSARGNEAFMEYAKKIFLSFENNTPKDWTDVCHRLENFPIKQNIKYQNEQMLLLEGYPDRLALKVSNPGDTRQEYQFTNGKKAFLHGSVKTDAQWIVALEVDAGESNALIYRVEEIQGEEFLKWIEGNAESKLECYFKDGKIYKEEQMVLGKICLSSKKLVPDSGDILPAWKNEVQKKGLKVLPFDDRCENFLLRVEYYRQQKDEQGSLSDMLADSIEEWLGPFITDGKELDSKIIYDALYWYLDGSKIDGEVPLLLEFPNGRKFKVIYEKNERIRPVVEVIIQRVFGCFSTPKVMGQNVLLKLLSPASRPLQITEDLENFWTTSWPEICKEMKGRYPKHNWDYRVVEN